MTPWFVAVGASGGEGLDDLMTLLHELPPNFGAVVLIVLHRPVDCLSELHAVLGRASRLPVAIALQGERFEPGTVYIGEPDDHLTLTERTFGKLIDDPTGRYRNRTVDLLFHSVAAHGGKRIIGVILSGALDDGARGLSAIHRAGGITMVLTPSVLPWRGMPENAIAFDGPVDLTGTPGEIARAIVAAVARGPGEPAAQLGDGLRAP
ncbi:chemotaxis protein CheB [Methylobacterium nigriterrae]|uniref:chemotaxis protein CheB n=1 Tax=Methylobacterium nigriterrae TaxID=3127512 RepID=UPI0030134132